MATEASLPASSNIDSSLSLHIPFSNIPIRRPPPEVPKVLSTVYSFPELEPLRFAEYPTNHLSLPLRRDILHRAVIYEGDMTRQGTASSKHRSEVHGSNRKIRPQKGTGKARLGNKKSPMLRGGGVAFGPHPRDFSTKLPRKVYDLAWRTALSYRYKKGELIIVQKCRDLETEEPRWLEQIMTRNHIGHADGRSLLVTRDVLPNLFHAMKGAGRHGVVKEEDDIDVKDLLEMGRVIIEKRALDSILRDHSSDLDRTVPSATYE